MSSFRQDLRAAFAAQQQGIEPLGESPQKVFERGLARAGRRAVLPQLAGALAVSLAIAVVVSVLMVMRLHQSTPAPARPTVVPTSVSATPTPLPSPTPVMAVFAAPDSVPALVFHDAVDRNQLDAVRWDGSGLGRLRMTGSTNRTGTLFATSTQILDRQGRPVAPLTVDGKGLPVWADDGRTLCRTMPETAGVTGVPATLQLESVGGQWRSIGQYGTAAESLGVGIAACSTLNDRAVLLQAHYQGGGASVIWVVQLSTGRVLWSRTYPLNGTAKIDVAASRDGSLVAVGQSTCCPRSGVATTLYGPSGELLGTFEGHAGGYAGQAFSWDGSRIVLASGADESQVSIVDVRTKSTVWRAPDGQKVAGVAVEPGGENRLGLVLNNLGAFAGPDGYVPAGNLYLVDSAGGSKEMPFEVRP